MASPPAGGRFKLMKPEVHRRLVCSIEGLEKTGKDHLALTANGDACVLDFDQNLEGVLLKFPEKKVYVCSYEYITDTDSQNAALDVWMQFKKDYTEGLRSFPNVIVDTGSQMWTVARMARFGKLSSVPPMAYGPINTEIKELIRQAKEADCNTMFLHRLKPVYVGKDRTDRWEMNGFGEFGYEVQATLQTYREDGEFHVRIVNCAQNMTIAGVDLEGEECNFNTILDMVFES